MHRFRPAYAMHARPLDHYPAVCPQAAAIMLMIQNNLDPAVAQHPYELVTYGGNGAVFQNWAQYLLTMKFLSRMSDEQTLPVYSGHPLGLFPSHQDAPRVVVTNGMVVPNYSSVEDYQSLNALGVTNYGQMTAGSYMYIGPQGIVHGTTIAILGAGRRYLQLPADSQSLAGKIYLSSGLGGMSGAQGKAAVIAGCVGVIAEINPAAVAKRREQGWVDEVFTELPGLLARVRGRARDAGEAVAIAYQGNIVDLWEALADTDHPGRPRQRPDQPAHPLHRRLLSRRLTFEESNALMASDPAAFRKHVQESLRPQLAAIDRCAARGTRFWDYGNAFLLECGRAGCAVARRRRLPLSELRRGRDGPGLLRLRIRPVPLGLHQRRSVRSRDERPHRRGGHGDHDRQGTAADQPAVPGQPALDKPGRLQQPGRGLAGAHPLQRCRGPARHRRRIQPGDHARPDLRPHRHRSRPSRRLGHRQPLSRDSEYPGRLHVLRRHGRAELLGDGCRGATWVSLHNGGGVGWGEVINGGFGLVLDGTEAGRAAPAPDAALGRETTAWRGAPGRATRAPSSPSGAPWTWNRAWP
jgi:urocanate hydratase